jgi:hypothetical protein
MADDKDQTTEPSGLKEHLQEARRGSLLFTDESKRRASVALLTSNTTGE